MGEFGLVDLEAHVANTEQSQEDAYAVRQTVFVEEHDIDDYRSAFR